MALTSEFEQILWGGRLELASIDAGLNQSMEPLCGKASTESPVFGLWMDS
jgi:hypothetical protein